MEFKIPSRSNPYTLLTNSTTAILKCGPCRKSRDMGYTRVEVKRTRPDCGRPARLNSLWATVLWMLTRNTLKDIKWVEWRFDFFIFISARRRGRAASCNLPESLVFAAFYWQNGSIFFYLYYSELSRIIMTFKEFSYVTYPTFMLSKTYQGRRKKNF